jgi:hypothetical protein
MKRKSSSFVELSPLIEVLGALDRQGVEPEDSRRISRSSLPVRQMSSQEKCLLD